MTPFEPIDNALARRLLALSGESDETLAMAIRLASAAIRDGHVALDLANAAGVLRRLNPDAPAVAEVPSGEALGAAVRASSLAKGDASPLVLVDDRLYLRRYFEHERALAEHMRRRWATRASDVDEKWLATQCAALFGKGDPIYLTAAREALTKRLMILCGGPGTGKTWTGVRLIALLIAAAEKRGERRPEVRMVAPTGKAAARLAESVAAAVESLAVDESVKRAIPRTARTIHGALGIAPGSVTIARHNAQRLLPADVVLVDESSMIDVSLFRRLLDAVRPDARVILLGDPDQLASVEAGAVLGDVVGAGAGVEPAIVRLTKSHRFDPESSIAKLAAAIRDGDGDGAIAALNAGGAVRWIPTNELGAAFSEVVREGFAPLLAATTDDARLAALDRFRLLTAHRAGPWGIRTLNPRIASVLGVEESHVSIVTRNDYDVGLFNGDVGVIVDERAVFAGEKGPRPFAVGRLPEHEPAFAMTVHKAQGSEVEHVAVVLPDERSPLLTRELFYTAVTRAKVRLTVFVSEAAVRAAVRHRATRLSNTSSWIYG